jgi:hypothetical protein
MIDVKEQRSCIKFSLQGRQRKQKMLKGAFRENALSLIQTYEWFKRF